MLKEAPTSILDDLHLWTNLSESDQDEYLSLNPESQDFQDLPDLIKKVIYTAIWMREWSTPPSQRRA